MSIVKKNDSRLTNDAYLVSGPRIIVALDFPDTHALLNFVDRLHPEACRLKIGKEVFTREGPKLIEQLMKKGFDIFLDLKFHDIPTTVAKACLSACELGVWMMNVHALGGSRMMKKVTEEVQLHYASAPLLIAVTLLTSLNESDLQELNFTGDMTSNVLRLASLAKQSNMQGVVASAWEAKAIKAACGQNFIVVTPGIRLDHDSKDDQHRIMTPTQAVENGADYLVMGRPITSAAEPLCVLERITSDLQKIYTLRT